MITYSIRDINALTVKQIKDIIDSLKEGQSRTLWFCVFNITTRQIVEKEPLILTAKSTVVNGVLSVDGDPQSGWYTKYINSKKGIKSNLSDCLIRSHVFKTKKDYQSFIDIMTILP